jgi:hypothetical protein
MTMSKIKGSKKNPATPLKRDDDENPGKIYPNPDDPNEQIGPPNREMPIINDRHHEEILDRSSD